MQQDVLAELKWEPSIEAAQVGVEVKDGIVTLSGHVSSFSEKWDAERAAQRVSGVRALVIELDVDLASSNQRTDADLARSAQNVLEWTTYLPKDSVKVMVEKGWLTLTGAVDWDYQRQAATVAIRHLVGVTGVTNQVLVKPNKISSAVKSDIEAALLRRARTDAQKIVVEVQGADVTLSGTAHSYAERDLARTSARSTAGVRNVIDNIAVRY